MSSEHPSRRVFLRSTVGAAMVAATMPGQASGAQANAPRALSEVRALVFDVFGTVVDWRSSVSAEVQAVARAKGVSVDGGAFADAWRAQYSPSMNRVRSGELPWTTLDKLHRTSLDGLLPQFGLASLSEPERASLSRAWHRLQPWPDAVEGLTLLKRRFVIAPLSNGNIALMTNMAKHAKLPWDCILGAELARHYKPDPEVYQSAADFLDLQPSQVMMVAAHLGDLRAAKAVGLQTAFVPRPDEYGHGPKSMKPDVAPEAYVDITANDFVRLARQLGA